MFVDSLRRTTLRFSFSTPADSPAPAQRCPPTRSAPAPGRRTAPRSPSAPPRPRSCAARRMCVEPSAPSAAREPAPSAAREPAPSAAREPAPSTAREPAPSTARGRPLTAGNRRPNLPSSTADCAVTDSSLVALLPSFCVFASSRGPSLLHPQPPIRAFVPSSLTCESPKITRTAVCRRSSAVVCPRLHRRRRRDPPARHSL